MFYWSFRPSRSNVEAKVVCRLSVWVAGGRIRVMTANMVSRAYTALFDVKILQKKAFGCLVGGAGGECADHVYG
jgi:hypothetical protein